MESPRIRRRLCTIAAILLGVMFPLVSWAASPTAARSPRARAVQPSTASRTVATPAPAMKEWTVLIYMACDNNLEAASEGDLNEMETVGSNDQLNILVQLDRIGSYSQDTTMKWTGAKRFHIKKDDNPNLVTSPIVQDLGEVDMASPKTLVDFVSWAKKRFPARQYALILSNHGTGWKEVQPDGVIPAIGTTRSRHPGYRSIPGGPEAAINPFGTPRRATGRQHADVLSADMRRAMGAISYNIAYDDTTGSSMDIPTLGDTLAKVQEVLQQPIDLLGFDACLMQMLEVAYESSPHARFQVGATDLEPERGWPYDQILEALAKDPDMDARKLGQTIVSNYTASYNSGSQGNTAVVLSLLDLTRMKKFIDSLERFCSSLHKDIVEVDAIDQARASALKYCYQDYVDLGHFSKLLAEKTKLTGLQRAARELLAEIKEDAKDGFVVANSHTGEKYADGSGISVYFPDRTSFHPFQKRYAQLKMSKESVWDDFLAEYENPNLPYIRIKDITLDDANHDGRITAGEKVDVLFTIRNLGRKTTDKIEFAWETSSKQVSFQKSDAAITIPKPGAETKVKGCEFTVSADAPANTQIPILFKLSGSNVPVSTYQTSFFVKPAFQTTGQALLVFTDNFSAAPPVLQAMFNEAGIKFDTWDRMMDGNLKPEVLKRYLDGWVYLCVQDSSEQQSLCTEEIDALTAFLRSGGRIVLSGQDLAYSLRESPFLKNFCRISFVQDDTNVHVLSGTANFLPAATCQIFGGDGANNQKWPDEIDPLAGAKVIMKFEAGARDIADHKSMRGPNVKPPSPSRGIKSSGAAAVSVVDGYRLLFFAFGVEAINTTQQRQQMIKQIQAFLSPALNTQITDYANASGRRNRNRGIAATQLLDDVDLLSSLRPRIIRQLRNSMERNPLAAESAMGQIERLPPAQRDAVNDLERDVRSLLEFQRQHGTLTPR